MMDENARKRKRDSEGEVPEIDGVHSEQPKEGLKVSNIRAKKQKKEMTKTKDLGNYGAAKVIRASNELPDPVSIRTVERNEKRECKAASGEGELAKAQVKTARKEHVAVLSRYGSMDTRTREGDHQEETSDMAVTPIEPTSLSGMAHQVEDQSDGLSITVTSPIPPTVFDVLNTSSGTSSISSIAPLAPKPPNPAQDEPRKDITRPKLASKEAQVRLRQRLEELRAARKADTIDGTPARNRQELMEARRKKEEQRRAHKKELRQKAREEERQQRDKALLRGSPLMSPALMSPASASNSICSPLGPHAETINNFAFGRIAFENGQAMTANLNAVINPHKAKGPQDPHTALQAAARRAERLSVLDPAKRADIEEKDVWLNARKRVHGERIRDDSSLLKKTLKRKDKAKKKSEKQWSERIEGVEKGKAIRQMKREENIQKRKEEKGSKGKKKVKGSKKGKSKPRPGFEGSFRAKVGGGVGGTRKK